MKDLYEAQLSLMLDPSDPAVIEQARKNDIPDAGLLQLRSRPYTSWRRSGRWLCLHPEYRTMPMVWYVPPLSPIVDLLRNRATMQRTATTCSALLSLSVPVEYLAELFTAGDTEVVTNVLRRLAAMRSYMRVTSTSVAKATRDCSGSWHDWSAGVRDVPPDGYR